MSRLRASPMPNPMWKPSYLFANGLPKSSSFQFASTTLVAVSVAERLGAGVPVESSFERFAVVVIGSVRADAT